jgi:hypothetical protein
VDSDIVCEVADVGVTVGCGVEAAEVGEVRGIAGEEGGCDVVVSKDNIANEAVVDDVERCCAIDSDGVARSASDADDVGAFVVTLEGVVVVSPSRSMMSALGGRADLTLIFFLWPLEDAAMSLLLRLDGLAPVQLWLITNEHLSFVTYD